MKIRFRGPSGAGSVEVADDATVSQLLTVLREQTGNSGNIAVKYGWPLQVLPLDQGDEELKSLGLHRESLTVIPLDSAQQQSGSASAGAAVRTGTGAPKPAETKTAALDAELAKTMSYGSGEHVEVDMPESRTTLVLRVMPDDGDCMFTAVAGALGGLVPLGAAASSAPVAGAEWTPGALRRLVVDTIRGDLVKYNANFLGLAPERYCSNLLAGMWGGAIELSILSDLFSLEIYSVDVKTGKAYQFGEQRDYEQFAVVMYSGIHYDRVAEAATPEAMNMVEFDLTRWSVVGNERIIRRSQDMCKILRDRHYYTSVSDFVVCCNDCKEILQGEKAIASHTSRTGHSGVTEVSDTR